MTPLVDCTHNLITRLKTRRRLAIITRKVVCILGLFCVSFDANSVPDFLDRWRVYYDQSSLGDIRCQLCHITREGGSPWNAYGRDLRNAYLELDQNSRTAEQAFELVESINSDQDTPATSNLQEIQANEQPGWREGRNNIGYDRNDIPTGTYFPPPAIDPFPTKLPVQKAPFELIEIANGFTSPLAGVISPIQSMRNQLFIVDQIGVIWRLDLITGEKYEYLNVQNRLVSLGAFAPGGYDERGLLGFAFHPNFSNNGLLYLHTSEPVSDTADFSTLNTPSNADHQSVITELTVDNPLSTNDPAGISRQRELMRIDQPQFNHNGGDLQFDANGLLYIALGDGGNADDQGPGHGSSGNAANPSNPLGAVLRIDPLGRNSENGQYGIPLSNPFIGHAAFLDEIFAYGLRNPWRLSFDLDGTLYAFDVGQNDIEEVNRLMSGQHYGWRIREGSFFFDPNGDFSGLVTREFPDNLPATTLVDPVFEYDHDEGISITGGHVYRGRANPSLFGKMVFTDFQRRLFVGDLTPNDTSRGRITALDISSDIFIYNLARDAGHELYIMGNTTAQTSGNTGKIFRLGTAPLTPLENSLCFPITVKEQSYSVVCL